MIQTPHFTEQKTKITFTHAGNKFKAVLPWDTNIEYVMDAFVGLLNAGGFHPDTIKEQIIAMAEEYAKERG